MNTPRISASSYSNTAPLIWPFLYGSQHGKVELVLDNAPARSAELLAQDRVDAALVPVIASQTIERIRIVPGVCVGAGQTVRSVCLVTRGKELGDIRSISLDPSSRTSVVLTKIIFREFLSTEPEWRDGPSDIDSMLAASDAALIIGDPALKLSFDTRYRTVDLAGLWYQHTGLGFIFAMWMTRRDSLPIDLAAARDEGLAHLSGIAASYAGGIGVDDAAMVEYLSENISFTPSKSMLEGMRLYFELAHKHRLIERVARPEFLE